MDCAVWFAGLGASDGSGCTETENPAAPGTIQWCILAGDASQTTTCESSISLGQCLNICDHWQWHWPLTINMVHCVSALCKASVCAEMKELHTFVGGSWCFDDGDFEDACACVAEWVHTYAGACVPSVKIGVEKSLKIKASSSAALVWSQLFSFLTCAKVILCFWFVWPSMANTSTLALSQRQERALIAYVCI